VKGRECKRKGFRERQEVKERVKEMGREIEIKRESKGKGER